MLLMVVGLPFSVFLMSISLFILSGNWLLEGNYKEKITRFYHNKAALLITSLFILHLIGLLYSHDFQYAFKDLRIKSPLFILPFIIGSIEYTDRKKSNYVLLIFSLAILISSLFYSFKYIIHPVADMRDVFVLVSHIRFGLLVDLVIFILFYFTFQKNQFKKAYKIVFIITAIWLFAFLIIAQLFTGFIILIITIFLLAIIYFILSKKGLWKLVPISILFIVILLMVLRVGLTFRELSIKKPFDCKAFTDTTALGNRYTFSAFDQQYENGNYVWIYICEKEMETAWNQRSKIQYTGHDLKGQTINVTLIRFLTSLGYRKDAEGVNKLSEEQIAAIESGVVDWKFMSKYGVMARYNQTMAEVVYYLDTKNPNGSSLVQRFEYWKTAMSLIKRNILIGVGTGDVQKAFKKEYNRCNSKLVPEYRLRAHNQFIEFTVTFGVIGLLWFLIALFYPVFKLKKFDFLYIAFFMIAFISMLTEDTLETQAGICFFVFFSCFFLFCRKGTIDKV